MCVNVHVCACACVRVRVCVLCVYVCLLACVCVYVHPRLQQRIGPQAPLLACHTHSGALARSVLIRCPPERHIGVEYTEISRELVSAIAFFPSESKVA